MIFTWLWRIIARSWAACILSHMSAPPPNPFSKRPFPASPRFRRFAYGRAGHGHHVIIQHLRSPGCRNKRSRAYRRAIGDPVNERWPKVTPIRSAARDGARSILSWLWSLGGLHPKPHVGAAAKRASKRTAISGVTALLPLMAL